MYVYDVLQCIDGRRLSNDKTRFDVCLVCGCLVNSAGGEHTHTDSLTSSSELTRISGLDRLSAICFPRLSQREREEAVTVLFQLDSLNRD